MSVTVRDAVETDLPRVVEIYNASIPGRSATGDLEPVTVESRRDWFAKFDPARRPLWVAEEAGEVVAWVGLGSYYGGRAAYDATAEVSLYVAPGRQRQGLGRDLIARVIAACPRLGVTTLLAMYFDHNAASRRLFDHFGFAPMGHLTEIAVLDGVRRGLVITGLRVPPVVG